MCLESIPGSHLYLKWCIHASFMRVIRLLKILSFMRLIKFLKKIPGGFIPCRGREESNVRPSSNLPLSKNDCVLWWEPHCYNVFQVPDANLHCAAVGPKRVGCQALKILMMMTMTIKMVMMMMLMTMTMIMCLVDFYPSVMTWRDSVIKYFPHDFFAKHQKQALCKICLSGLNSRPKNVGKSSYSL